MIQHRYWVLLATCLWQAIFGAMMFGSSPLLVGILDTYRTTRVQAGLVLSMMPTFFCVTALFAGAILHKFGTWMSCGVGSVIIAVAFSVSFFATSVLYLIVSIGFFAGCGLALLYVSCAPTVCQHFTGRAQVMALTVMTVSSSVGAMAASYGLGVMLESYGLRGTFLLMGGFTLNATVVAPLCRTKPMVNKVARKVRTAKVAVTDTSVRSLVSSNNTPQMPVGKSTTKVARNVRMVKNTVPDNTENNLVSPNDTPKVIVEEPTTVTVSKRSLKDIFRNVLTDRVFLLFALGNGINIAAHQSASIYMVDTMQDSQQSSSIASVTPVLFNLSALVGRLLCGLVKLIPHCSSLDVAVLSSMLGIAGCLIIAMVSMIQIKLVAWCLNGVAMGIGVAGISITTARLLGKENLATGIGFALTVRGVVGTFFGPMHGYIRDITGSYQFGLICTSGILLLVGLFYVLAKVYRIREKSKVTVTKL